MAFSNLSQQEAWELGDWVPVAGPSGSVSTVDIPLEKLDYVVESGAFK